MRTWFRVDAFGPHMTFLTEDDARTAMRNAGVTGRVTRYRETRSGVIAQIIR